MVGLSPSKQVFRVYIPGGGISTNRKAVKADAVSLTCVPLFFKTVTDPESGRSGRLQGALHSGGEVGDDAVALVLEAFALGAAECEFVLRRRVVDHVVVHDGVRTLCLGTRLL